MPRDHHDREDLLAEATALVERAELSVPNYREAIVVGFRRDCGVSIYFGADPVYQFNSHGQLRRAHVDGLLIKADHGRLAALRRERILDRVDLVRHDLTVDEASGLLTRIIGELNALREAIATGQCQVLRQVPAGVDLLARIHQWLDDVGPAIAIAHSPCAG